MVLSKLSHLKIHRNHIAPLEVFFSRRNSEILFLFFFFQFPLLFTHIPILSPNNLALSIKPDQINYVKLHWLSFAATHSCFRMVHVSIWCRRKYHKIHVGNKTIQPWNSTASLKVILLSKNDVDFGDFLYLTASMAIATSAS